MVEQTDIVVIGAGMAGASAAYELSRMATVILIEREAQAGYHSTGRSAAVFTEIYGNATIRALTVASAPFFAAPPERFSDYALWSPRPLIMIGRHDQDTELADLYNRAAPLSPSIQRLDAVGVLSRAPMLRADYVAGGVLEPNASDLDVNAIQAGFLLGARSRGAALVPNADVKSLGRYGGQWRVETSAGAFEAKVVVNAAGAWADEIGALAGARRIGLVPKRRTAFTFSFDPPQAIEHWPTIIDVSEEFYFKPESGKLLGSPADETPSAPCDAWPEDIDIAIAIDRISTATNLAVRTVSSKWAGLRSFVSDNTPVVGYDETVEDFFWLAGQGGYGIQIAPALSRLAAALVARTSLPDDICSLGIDAAALSPARRLI